MMDVTFFIKEVGFESGVIVSVKHLQYYLSESGVMSEVIYYHDDFDLIKKVADSNSRCINLQVPSFTEDTFKEIMGLKENIVVSIHSTMCNLQTEEGMLGRLLDWNKIYKKNLRITCPSSCETDGFNYLNGINFLYLPNTFSYIEKEESIEVLIKNRICGFEKLKISLFCAFRPLKNMIVQVAAITELAKKYNIELHIFQEKSNNPIFNNIQQIAEKAQFELIIHGKMSNYECYELTKQMHLGLQVSLSETFSYVAFEHMSTGIPIIGSLSVPFATKIADYSNVNDIIRCIQEVIDNKADYLRYSKISRETAVKIIDNNKIQALNTINTMIKGVNFEKK